MIQIFPFDINFGSSLNLWSSFPHSKAWKVCLHSCDTGLLILFETVGHFIKIICLFQFVNSIHNGFRYVLSSEISNLPTFFFMDVPHFSLTISNQFYGFLQFYFCLCSRLFQCRRTNQSRNGCTVFMPSTIFCDVRPPAKKRFFYFCCLDDFPVGNFAAASVSQCCKAVQQQFICLKLICHSYCFFIFLHERLSIFHMTAFPVLAFHVIYPYRAIFVPM